MEDSGELNIVALVKEHLRQSESCGEKSGRLSNMIEFLKRAKSEHEASAIPSLQDGLDELTTQWDKFKTFSEETDKLKIILDKTDGETCEIQGQLAALTRRDEYTKQRDLFNEYSGLQFEVNQDETLALNLTKIDPNDPSGMISVHLCLKDNTATNYQWSFVSSDYDDDREIELLVNELNSSNNFHLFCQKVRQLLIKKKKLQK